MTFELLPHLTPFLIGFFTVVAIGAATLAYAMTSILRAHRSVRLVRHESIPRYYRELAFSH